MRYVGLLLLLALLFPARPAYGQFGFGNNSPSSPTAPSAPTAERWQAGLIIMARTGPCGNVYATVPLPTEWPEQDVKIASEKISDNVGRVRYRTLDGPVRQMLVTIRQLSAGQQAEALLTFSITRRSLPVPDPATLQIASDPPRDVRKYLGPSPDIEPRNAAIRSQVKELTDGQPTAWGKLQAIHGWVQDKIEQRNGPVKGSVRTLRDGFGNHEDMAALFIALCRAGDIPARTVWVPGYCYPEFYLEDDQGEGHWIPCEVKEKGALGSVAELLPILQKGDAFKVPEKKETLRFVAEFMKGGMLTGGGQPTVRWVRQLLPPE